jgi:hypothetical protein
MLVYTKSRVAISSFLFPIGTVTGVIIAPLALLRLTGFLIGLYIGLKHGLYKEKSLAFSLDLPRRSKSLWASPNGLARSRKAGSR